MVLPSNSSMCYFPENTTTFFITELPHTIHLHEEWEVALSEIQFFYTYFFTRMPRGNVLKFIDIKHCDEKDEGPFIAKEVIIPAFTKISRSLSPRLIQGAKAPNHICFEQQNAAGGKTAIRLSCANDGNYKTTHYINFSNNLLRIFDLEGNVAYHVSLKIHKSNSNVHNTVTYTDVR